MRTTDAKRVAAHERSFQATACPGGADGVRRQRNAAAGAVATELGESAGLDLDALILRRVRIVLGVFTGAVVLTTIVDLPAGNLSPFPLFELKVLALGLAALGYVISRWQRALPYATAVAWLVPSTACAGLSLTGIASGESAGAVIMCIGAAFVAAMLFPWSVRAQAATAAWAGATIAANVHWASGYLATPVSDHAAVVAAAALAVSVVITYERQWAYAATRRQNRARARARARTAALNQQLEQLVLERTTRLEATRKDLETQVAEHAATLDILRTQEQQLVDVLDNSSALIYVKDLQGCYRFMGIQIERLFRLTRGAMIGKTVADFLPPQQAAAITAEDCRVLAAGQAVEEERTWPHEDGPHTYLSLKFPLRDAAGTAYGLCGIATDITSRTQMEDDLRRTAALLSSVIESSDEAIWSLDRHYRFTALNAVVKRRFRELFSTDPDVGGALDDCLPATQRRYWRALYEQALLGQPLVVEHQITIAGAPHQLLVSLNPISEDGAVTGVVVFTKEITTLRRTEEQLRQHQAELAHALRLSTIGEMTTGMAQTLRRPLAIIAREAQRCGQDLQSGHLDTAAFAQRIGRIGAEALDAAESLRQLRRLVRKDSPTHDGIDVNAVVRHALGIVDARHPDLPLQLTLAPDLPRVHGDSLQVEQVALNLLLNAVDALQAVPSEQRALAVETGLVDGHWIEVAVRDTGSGLDPLIGDRLFDPFVTTKPKGLGMGLAISRTIVEAHQGRLWVTPNPEGGSTFHFTLPLP